MIIFVIISRKCYLRGQQGRRSQKSDVTSRFQYWQLQEGNRERQQAPGSVKEGTRKWASLDYSLKKMKENNVCNYHL